MGFPLQLYDVFMIAVLVFSLFFGAWKGMAWQIASVAAILVSAQVAVQFGGLLAPYISSQEPWNRFLAMFVLYAATSLIIWIIFRMVAAVINRVQLKEFDRQLGMLVGGIKGVLWCIVITFFTVTLSEPARQTVLKSQSGYYIAVLTQRATPVLPEEVRAVVGKYIEELDRKLDPSTPAEPVPAEAPGIPLPPSMLPGSTVTAPRQDVVPR